MNEIHYSEALETIVAGANIAGMLEEQGEIGIDSDMQLTDFLVDIYNQWKDNEIKIENYYSYIAAALMERFGYKEE
jgi:hypothetical protein